MGNFMKNYFYAILFLPLLYSANLKSHDKPAHEICLNAKDYRGCISENTTFSYFEKISTAGVMSAMMCMERRSLIDKEESNEILESTLKEMGIASEILKDSQVLRVAEKISYLYQVDCRTKKDVDQIKMQKLLSEEFLNINE